MENQQSCKQVALSLIKEVNSESIKGQLICGCHWLWIMVIALKRGPCDLPTLLPGSEGFHTLICYFMTDTVLENTLVDVRKHWRRRELKKQPVCFAKLLWWNLSLFWIPQRYIEGEKGIQWRGSCALLGTEEPHTQQELGLLWAFSSSGFSSRSLAGFGEEKHTIQHSLPVPFLPFCG